jgi:hypothetical protein
LVLGWSRAPQFLGTVYFFGAFLLITGLKMLLVC